MSKDIDAALRVAREYGGPNIRNAHMHPPKLRVTHALKHVEHEIHEGPIHSSVAGRTDHLPMHVPEGSYVVPADVISGMGEGNTMAGFKHMHRMFGGTPYGGGAAPYNQESSLPYGAHMAKGGATGSVPIVAAGGEHVLSPEQVREVGGGDLERGHRVLDNWVLTMRKELIKTLKKLPGPRRD